MKTALLGLTATLAATLAASLAGAPPAGAAANGAPTASGAHLAKTVCATCHAIDADRSKHSPDPQAPRFVDVAVMPSTTELAIKVFLRSPHKNMPNLLLNESEIDAIAAYILDLRNK